MQWANQSSLPQDKYRANLSKLRLSNPKYANIKDSEFVLQMEICEAHRSIANARVRRACKVGGHLSIQKPQCPEYTNASTGTPQFSDECSALCG
jgi:hypothetical protein